MSLLRVDQIENRTRTGGPVIVGLTTISGGFISSNTFTAQEEAIFNEGLQLTGIGTFDGIVVTDSQLDNVRVVGLMTAGIITGATYFGEGGNLSGIVTYIEAGTNIEVSANTGKVIISATGLSTAEKADYAGLATDIQGGAAGELVYQAGNNDTAFLTVGVANSILISGGPGNPPLWSNFSTASVGFADSAGITTNIFGGGQGRLVYQSDVDTTAFVAQGNAEYILQSNANAAPSWINPDTFTVGFAGTAGISTFAETAGIATNVIGGIGSISALLVSGLSTFTTGDVDIQSNLSVDNMTNLTNLRVSGLSTFNNGVDVGGNSFFRNVELQNINVTAGATFNGQATFDGTIEANGFTDLTNVVVGGALTVQSSSNFLDIEVDSLSDLSDVSISGVATVGNTLIANNDVGIGTDNPRAPVSTANTSVLSAGIVTAVTYYGDGSNLRGAFPKVPNIIYVTKAGDDTNSGFKLGEAKATIQAALGIATEGTTIKVSTGIYEENNPLLVGKQVSIIGDSLREVDVRPINPGSDLFHVKNGSYISDMSFTGIMSTGSAIVAFDPNPNYIDQSPYIRNCTNFVQNSVGMRIDGKDAIGEIKSMVVDSYTQYNQNGVGVSIINRGYAQLVSIFTICNETAIFCGSGGQCDLTNSNSSFGTFGLIADAQSEILYTGIITSATVENADVIEVEIQAPVLNISNAVYDNTVGLVTFTTSSNHNLNVGMAVTVSPMQFTCDSVIPVTNFNVNGADYDNTTGIMTVTTDSNHNFKVGVSVTFSGLDFSCAFGSKSYPEAGDDFVFDVLQVGTTTSFTVNIGVSTLAHTYVANGVVAISTIQSFPSGDYGYIFDVEEVQNATTFTANVGPSTFAHTYQSGGTVQIDIDTPYDGQSIIIDELYYELDTITITSGGSGYTVPPIITISSPSESWGIQASAVASLTNGIVTEIDIASNGRGYSSTPPTITIANNNSGINTATATATVRPVYSTVQKSTPISSGICTITLNDNIPYAVGVGSTVPFFKQSRILASSHSFEYVGSGTDINTALPQVGGVAIQENETVSSNGGLVIFTTTDQAGNFRIGDGVIINQQTGTVSGQAYSKSLFASVTPTILALGGF